MCSSRRGLVLLATLASVVTFSGCASTSLTVDHSLRPEKREYRRVLVVVFSSDWDWRNELEADFKEDFESRGMLALVAHEYITAGPDGYYSIDAMNQGQLNTFRSLDVDAYIFVGAGERGYSTTGYMLNQYGATPINKPSASNEISLLDRESSEVIWRAQAWSRGNAFATMGDLRVSLVGKVAGALAEAGLIPDRCYMSCPPIEPVRVEVEAKPKAAPPVRDDRAAPVWRRAPPAEGEIIRLTAADFNPQNHGSLFARAAAATVVLRGERGHGSAFLISRDGLALTNFHVVERQGELSARFQDGRERAVRVLRLDQDADVALLQISCAEACPTLDLAIDGDPEVGSDVLVIGAPFAESLSYTVTKGVVSGLRFVEGVTLVQTDAAVNRGSSGGPLLDVNSGRVRAIVTLKLTGQNVEGLGFGVSITDALRTLGVKVVDD